MNSKSFSSGIGYRIDNLIHKIQKVERVNSLSVPFFPGRYGSRYLKHEEDDFRIVAELLTINEFQIIYLHTIFVHDKEYRAFISEIKAGRFPYVPDLEAVGTFVRQQQAEENSRIKAHKLQSICQRSLRVG